LDEGNGELLAAMLHYTPQNAAIHDSFGLQMRTIAERGKNCGRIEIARRAAVLVDGAAYFSTLAQCLLKARRSIIIVAWDFDGAIRLEPCSSQQTVGSLLRSLVDQWPQLHVNILVWSEATIHAPGATLPLLLGDDWSSHPRIRVRLDKHHPIYAAHHQKIITIDDELAFVGGMDLTVDRWDTPSHELDCRQRVTPDGDPYGPVHDVQMVLEGAAAKALADIARQRWRIATGEDIPPSPTDSTAWPHDLLPQFEDVAIAISTVSPRWRGDKGCSHSLQMTLDAIEAADKSIYLEAQYFTSRRVGRAIAESLAKPKGPNILVVVGLNSHGFIEHYVMARNRDRLARKLLNSDPHNRFRIYYPILPSGKDLKLHSKVMVIDDNFLRIGSSNFNNRSEGVDTECDVTVEAQNEQTRSAIVGVRDGLIAEHLGVEAEVVSRAIRDDGLFAAIDRLNVNERALKKLPQLSRTGPTRSVFGTWLLDPTSPFIPRFRFG
jgi:phosphatidylserine/phosphatidylglycerophosphate/cardiolipin synthase-like enzyme